MQELHESIDIIPAKLAVSIPELFAKRAARSPAKTAYIQFDKASASWRHYSWSDVASFAATLQRALIRMPLRSGERVCLFLRNCIEWVAIDIAAMSLGLVPVPIYHHDSVENAAFILANSGARLLITDTLERWEALAPLAEQSSQVEQVWLTDAEHSLPSGHFELRLLLRPDSGSQETLQRPAVKADDLATLIYTSGTTGRPKGVMLSHASILWNVEAATRFIPPLTTDIFLSILPLAHAFERTLGHYLPMMAGATVAYARSVDMFRADLAIIRPTVLLAVPRLYERVHAVALESAGQSRLKMALLRVTAEIGWSMRQAKHGRGPWPGIAKRLLWLVLKPLVARGVMQAFGGRLRVAVSGGASLPPDVARFLMGMGLPLVEGYGLTEAGPVVTACTIQDSIPGSVGRPLHKAELRIAHNGELLVRSPGVMKGYWHKEVATRRALNGDGWLHTGDSACMADGRVDIEGRLTDTVVLSTGQKIDLIEVERALARDPLFDQNSVVGTGRPCPVALIVLNPQRWEIFASQEGLDPARPNLAEAKLAVLNRILTRQVGGAQHTLIRGVHLILKPWTIADGLLTPTLKVKKRAVEEKYNKEIRRLYDEIGLDSARRA